MNSRSFKNDKVTPVIQKQNRLNSRGGKSLKTTKEQALWCTSTQESSGSKTTTLHTGGIGPYPTQRHPRANRHDCAHIYCSKIVTQSTPKIYLSPFLLASRLFDCDHLIQRINCEERSRTQPLPDPSHGNTHGT